MFKLYHVQADYNDDGHGGYTGEPFAAYYRVVAENELHSTVYQVNIIPGVRNKQLTLELATDKTELAPSLYSRMDELYDSSAALYQEIYQKYGQIQATVKELKGTEVDNFQTKWFESPGTQLTEPDIYRLKAHVYDISVKLPVGYTYDAYLLGEGLDNSQLLLPTGDGFSGKKLILSQSAAQRFHIRIVLKRDQPYQWGGLYLDTGQCPCTQQR